VRPFNRRPFSAHLSPVAGSRETSAAASGTKCLGQRSCKDVRPTCSHQALQLFPHAARRLSKQRTVSATHAASRGAEGVGGRRAARHARTSSRVVGVTRRRHHRRKGICAGGDLRSVRQGD